jgi:hypothetical protein
VSEAPPSGRQYKRRTPRGGTQDSRLSRLRLSQEQKVSVQLGAPRGGCPQLVTRPVRDRVGAQPQPPPTRLKGAVVHSRRERMCRMVVKGVLLEEDVCEASLASARRTRADCGGERRRVADSVIGACDPAERGGGGCVEHGRNGSEACQSTGMIGDQRW